MDIETIIRITRLSKEEIEKIREDTKKSDSKVL